MNDTTEMFGPEWQLRSIIARARAGETLANDVLRVLRDAHREIAEDVAKLGIDNPTRARYTALLKSIEKIIDEAYADARRVATEGLLQIDAAERAALAGVAVSHPPSIGLELGTQVPRALAVQAAALPHIVDEIPLRGINFGQWWTQGAKAALSRVQDQVQIGLVRGEHPHQIARRVHHAKSKVTGTAGGEAWKGTVKAARTVMRTAVTAVQTRASLDGMRAAGITRVRFEAILDARTSVICAALDDSEYDIDDADLPLPPRHPQCRSALVPIVTWASGPNAGKPVIPRGRSYESWLREQTDTTQNKILGRTRAEAWRKGYVSLGDLIARDSRPLRLTELADQLRPH
ncbi:MAG: minor capsid protein [Gemmatimonadaceae bacterium]|nr:minor capsid protein [Gemmatimonadaceae bacterium]